MANRLTQFDVTGVSLVDRAAVRDHANPTEPQRLLLWKRDSEGGNMPTTDEVTAALAKAETERDELRKQLTDQTDLAAKLKKAEDDLTAATEALEKATKKPESTEIDKSELPQAVREALEKAETDRKEMADRLEKAEKTANAERDERLTRDYITKAEKDYADLVGVSPGDFGIVLKNIAGAVDEKTFEALDTVLKSNSEAINKGELFGEKGRAGDPTPQGAVAEALAKAEEIQKSDPKLSHADALDRALSNDRALAQRYLDENR